MNLKQLVPMCCALLMLLPLSCSKDDPAAGNSPTSENSWKLNTYSYSGRTSTQTSTTFANGDPFTILYIDSRIANQNNPFSNCSLILTFNTSTEGEYIIKSQATALSNSKLKYMHVRCIVMSSVGTGATYDSMDGDLTALVTQVDGKYLVTISSGTSLTRTANDGLTEAPDSFILTADKVR